MKVFESQYRTIEFFPEKELIRMVYFMETENLTDEAFKVEETRMMELLHELKPKKFLSNLRDMRFNFSLEMQEWVLEHVYTPASKLGIERVAYIQSTEFVMQVSAEQIIDDYGTNGFKNKFFDNEEDAMKWLFS